MTDHGDFLSPYVKLSRSPVCNLVFSESWFHINYCNLVAVKTVQEDLDTLGFQLSWNLLWIYCNIYDFNTNRNKEAQNSSIKTIYVWVTESGLRAEHFLTKSLLEDPELSSREIASDWPQIWGREWVFSEDGPSPQKFLYKNIWRNLWSSERGVEPALHKMKS